MPFRSLSHALICVALAAGVLGCSSKNAPKNPYDIGSNVQDGGAAGGSGSGSGGGAGQSAAGSGGAAGTGASGTGAAGGGGSSGSAGGSGGTGGTGGTGSDDPRAPGGSDSYYPLADGATFTYHHTNPAKPAWDEVATLTATTYNGKPAFILSDQEDAQGEQTRSTLQVQGTGVWRVFRDVTVSGQTAVEVTYDPAFLRFDEAWTMAGQMMTLADDWTQVCHMSSAAQTCSPGATTTGTTTHTFNVIATSAKLTVPAGTFDTVEVERTKMKTNSTETKRFWFARGVGKVREEDLSSGSVEELSEYHIP
jgi:hypothetical protein